MHRSLLTTFAAILLTAAPALADWPLGSQELGPAPRPRSRPSVAASGHGVLAVWADSRTGTWDLLAARMDTEGRPLATIRIASGLTGDPVVATDGESHLVLWRDGTLRGATMDSEGGVTAPDLGSLTDFYPTRLVWNGSFYLATSSRGGMVLLDRQGSIASGVLTIPFQAHQLTVASSGRRWFVAGRLPDRSGMVDVADFPPIGEWRAFDLPFVRDPLARAPFELAAFLDGYVSVDAGNTNELAVQLYDSSGEPSGEVQRLARPERVTGVYCFTARNRALYIAYRTCTARCTSDVVDIVEVRFGPNVSERRRDLESDPGPGRFSEITLLGTMSGRYPTSLVSTAAGVLAIADDGVWDRLQLYSALVGSEAFRNGGTLLSADRALQRSPHIASAAGRHLVVWIEESGSTGERGRVAGQILENDGRPAGDVTLPDIPFEYGLTPEVASDGINFLLVWLSRDDGQIHGMIVSRDGEILRQPFAIPTRNRWVPSSVVWNGLAYVISVGSEIVLVGAGGTILEPCPAGIEDFPRPNPADFVEMLLARDGDALLILGIGYECPPFDGMPCTVSYETAVRQTDLTYKDGEWNGRTFCCGVTGQWPAAIAAGGGHRLFVWAEYSWSRPRRPETGHVVGDAHRFDFETDSGTHPPRAVWTGSGFLVAQGPTLLRHDPWGLFLERRSLGDDVRESNIAMGSVPFVVMERQVGVSRLFVRPLDH